MFYSLDVLHSVAPFAKERGWGHYVANSIALKSRQEFCLWIILWKLMIHVYITWSVSFLSDSCARRFYTSVWRPPRHNANSAIEKDQKLGRSKYDWLDLWRDVNHQPNGQLQSFKGSPGVACHATWSGAVACESRLQMAENGGCGRREMLWGCVFKRMLRIHFFRSLSGRWSFMVKGFGFNGFLEVMLPCWTIDKVTDMKPWRMVAHPMILQ